MPTRKISVCDTCGNEINGVELFIYKISLWNTVQCKEITTDFVLNNGECAMFCSDECVGVFIRCLIHDGVDSE